ncbi:MAG: MerC domain-containing protein [Gammaproteobacteria bacterium]|nr:MerC domain-containing protein [Gammaproteobacteria bacterium]
MQALTMSTDKAAIGLSLICVVHCLLTPVAIAMVPALGATFLEGESFHYMVLFLVLPTSLFALGLGCRKHRGVDILAIGLLGLLVLFLVPILGEDVTGEIGEKALTIAGAAIIAYAHVRNFRLCRQHDCHHDAQALPSE